MEADIHIGTSGWSYRHWKARFYKNTPARDWLSFYAQHLNSMEINGTFYRLQNPNTFNKWYSATPDNFCFSLKANRYLTHTKKLLEPESSINLEREHALYLDDKLKVVLWQLPANFLKNISRLEKFINALTTWQEVRHTIEFRHKSWFDIDIKNMLAENNIAICQSDAVDWPLWSEISTNLVYIRLHGHKETYISSYSTTLLHSWAKKIHQWLKEKKQVYVYFDNDAYAHAPLNAMQLTEMLQQH